jgi:hypothetical protein
MKSNFIYCRLSTGEDKIIINKLHIVSVLENWIQNPNSEKEDLIPGGLLVSLKDGRTYIINDNMYHFLPLLKGFNFCSTKDSNILYRLIKANPAEDIYYFFDRNGKTLKLNSKRFRSF